MPADLYESVKTLFALGRDRGYVTIDELNRALPQEQVSTDQIEDTMAQLAELGINVVENFEIAENSDSRPPVVAEDAYTRAVPRLEMAIAAIRHGRLKNACQLLKTTLMELEAFLDQAE